MEKIEYRDVIDKTGWPRGPWTDEPDKVQWPDEATGLPCLALRGPGGHWCGYVGVPKGHPLHGIEYGQCRHGENCPEKKGDEHYSYCDHRPEGFLEAHGGITFSSGCSEPGNRTEWQEFRQMLAGRTAEAKKYPTGDSARAIEAWAPVIDNYEAWVERRKATSVCHIPAQGEPDHVWWFGFDCAHAGDKSPAYANLSRSFSRSEDVYRDLPYVQAQCAAMAKQLAAVTL